jgi:hypothetical protein
MQTTPRKVPTAVMAIAVLNFCFAGVGLCWFLISPDFLNQSHGKEKFGVAVRNKIESELPGYKDVQMVRQMTNALFSLALVGIGFGLLYRRTWARLGAFYWAMLCIAITLGGFVYDNFFVKPIALAAVSEVLQNNPPTHDYMAAFMSGGAEIQFAVLPFLALCFLIYPTFVLIVMMKPTVRQAFSGQPALDPLPAGAAPEEVPPHESQDDAGDFAHREP